MLTVCSRLTDYTAIRQPPERFLPVTRQGVEASQALVTNDATRDEARRWRNPQRAADELATRGTPGHSLLRFRGGRVSRLRFHATNRHQEAVNDGLRPRWAAGDEHVDR